MGKGKGPNSGGNNNPSGSGQGEDSPQQPTQPSIADIVVAQKLRELEEEKKKNEREIKAQLDKAKKEVEEKNAIVAAKEAELREKEEALKEKSDRIDAEMTARKANLEKKLKLKAEIEMNKLKSLLAEEKDRNDRLSHMLDKGELQTNDDVEEEEEGTDETSESRGGDSESMAQSVDPTPTQVELPRIKTITGYDTEMQALYDDLIRWGKEQRSSMYEKIMDIEKFDTQGMAGLFDSNEFSAIIAYQGFKPFEMAGIIMRRMQKSGSQHDIHRLIQIGHERGNNLDKMMKGASKEFLTLLRNLRSIYCLKSKPGKNPYTITLSRICMSFPHLSCSFARINRNPAVSISVMDNVSEEYPKEMMTSAFGSLIPNLDESYCKDLIDAHLIHQYEFTMVVSPEKTRPKSPAAALPDLMKYLKAATTGSILSVSSRISLLLEWDLIEEANGKMVASSDVMGCAHIWRTRYLGRAD